MVKGIIKYFNLLYRPVRLGKLSRTFQILFFLLVVINPAIQAQLSVNLTNTGFTQNFDGLGPAATTTTKDTLPASWGFRLAPKNLNTQDWNLAGDTTNRAGGTTGTGVLTSMSSGGTYNFGNGDNTIATDRALGFIHSGSYAGPSCILLRIVNNTGAAIQSIYISFDYEKYRTAARAWNWYFIHGSTSDPVTDTVAAGAQAYPADADRNTVYNPPLSVTKSFLLSNLNIPNGASYYFKWVLVGNGGSTNGQALAIDNFCLKAFSTPTVTGSCTGPTSNSAHSAVPTATSTTANLQISTPATNKSIVIASTSRTLSSDPVSGVAYTASNSFGSGSALGGGFVVYTGSATSVLVTNLQPATKYYFFVFAYTEVVNSLSCITSPLPCYKTTALSTTFPNSYIDSVTCAVPSQMVNWNFRTRQSGTWSDINTWEAFNPNTSAWVNADVAPNENSASIIIQTAHTVELNSQTGIDSLTVDGILRQTTGGIMNLNNGTANYDLRIRTGGTWRIESGGNYNATVLQSSGSRIRVDSSGKITIGAGSTVGADYGALGYISGLVDWANSSVFEWNSTTAFAYAGTEYFPDTTSSVIPVFRLSAVVSLGAGSTLSTSFYGLFEANAAISFPGTGIKTFRNGIIGTASVTQVSASGRFVIDGPTAVLGGSGSILLNSNAVSGMDITAGVTNMLSSKSITGGTIAITNIFNSDTFTLAGSITSKLTISGTFTTKNPNGFHELVNSAVNSSISGANITFPLNALTNQYGTVDYISTGHQKISSISNGAGSAPYGNLSSSGGGARTLTNTRVIKIQRAFNPGNNPSLYTVTGSAIEFVGDSTQTIPGFTYNILIVSPNAAGGLAMKTTAGTASNPVTVLDSLKVNTNSTLRMNTDVVLKSTSTQTARVGIQNGAVTYPALNPGRFVIERYIKPGRKWQFLAAPITNSFATTLKVSWMENAAAGADPNPGYGTIITSNDAAWSTNGYDGYSPGGPSIKKYNAATQSYDPITSTGSLIYNLNGYFLYVRGDRSCLPANSNVSATVLRTRGRLNTVSVDVPANNIGWVSVGNPYPSAIDLRSLRLTDNLTLPITTFYIWDPQLTGSYGVGGFVTCSYNSNLNQYDATSNFSFGNINNIIESGQAFFINLPNAATRSVRIPESAKTFGSRSVFRPGPITDRLRIDLKYRASDTSDAVLMDGSLIYFDPANNNQTDQFDAVKLFNSGENIAIKKDNVLLAIEKRQPVLIGDTIFLHTGPYRFTNYRLEIDATSWQLDNSLRAFVFDSYKNSFTPLPTGEVINFDFTLDATSASRSTSRFCIVFRRPGLSLGNTKSESLTSNDDQVKNLEINDSKNGQSTLAIFPNPVEQDYFSARMEKATSGLYIVQIIDAGGKRVFARPVMFMNGLAQINMDGRLAPGTYSLIIVDALASEKRYGQLLVR